jgi:hypothetical protein
MANKLSSLQALSPHNNSLLVGSSQARRTRIDRKELRKVFSVQVLSSFVVGENGRAGRDMSEMWNAEKTGAGSDCLIFEYWSIRDRFELKFGT